MASKGKCGPCFLCKRESTKYVQYERMDMQVAQLINAIENCSLQSEDYICHSCYKQASRNVSNPSFHPRWKPKQPSQKTPCVVVDCNSSVYRHTNIVSREEAESFLGHTLEPLPITDSIPLCQEHYTSIRARLQTRRPCEYCGSMPKWGEKDYFRHCPSPELVNSHLSESNDACTLTASSIICMSCYRFFNQIIARVNDGQSACNSLEAINPKLDSQISYFQEHQDISKPDYFELNLCYTAQTLIKVMANDEVILLPILHNIFRDHVINGMAVCKHLNISNEEIPSTRWIMSKLNNYFGDNIVFQCKHRYVGTMVLLKNCDLLKALSNALGKLKKAQERPCIPEGECTTPSPPSLEDSVHNVAVQLNAKIHQQAKHFITAFKNTDMYTTWTISSLIKKTDPLLLKLISLLTKPASKSKKKLFGPLDDDSNDDSIDLKSIRHFYIISIILFNANRKCSAPLHVLLSEAIVCHGGNKVLLQLMNRIGACASLDTCDRLATYVVEKRMIEGVKPSLVPQRLTIASVDNVDILQPYAVVSTLDATRSWHGTSSQLMQPTPETGILSQQEMATTQQQALPSTSGSPILVLRSKRRRRTITEQCSPHAQQVRPPQASQVNYADINYEFNQNKPTINNFVLSHSEKDTRNKLLKDLHLAMLMKHSHLIQGGAALLLPSLPSLIHCLKKQAFESECSNVVYLDVLSERADSKATLHKVIGNIHRTFIQELNQKWVIVVGDAKVYDILQAIRVEYGNNLKWLIPFPGDWHIMYNYQKVLMKPYADAGLMDLAKASGYRAETLTSLRNAKNFRKTHLFILQCFETFYNFFLSVFERQHPDTDISSLMSILLTKFEKIDSDASLEEFRQCVTSTITNKVNEHLEKFQIFLEDLTSKQDTIKFWHDFVFKDCFPYISLFMGIRYRNWDMRTGGLKELVAVYAAFDRKTYEALLPRHLHDLALLPNYLLEKLKKGGFAIRLSNKDWSAVALDECHEMKINKDSKLAVVRPTPEKMKTIASYLPFRSKCVNHLKSQILPAKRKQPSCYTATTRDKATTANVKSMLGALTAKGMHESAPANMGLWNIFANKEATPEQKHDLLNFRSVGQQSFEHFVKYRLLREVSTNAPVRMKRLCTFTTTAAQKKRIKQADKERKISQRFLKRQLAWAAENKIQPTNSMLGPISSYPRALMDKDSLPYKSSKSLVTDYIITRYKHAPLVVNSLPWVPTSIILEGMFMIQTTPLATTESMREYTRLLWVRYVQPHFNAGAIVVHVVFDNPGGLPETPKALEQSRRDLAKQAKLEHHKCMTFDNNLHIPEHWDAVLACRSCKSALTAYLANEFLQLAPNYMATRQEFITNVKETAFSTDVNRECITRPTFSSNIDEGDMLVWLHCLHTPGTRVLIFSPDTDVYQIGLTHLQLMPGKEVIIQLSRSLTISPKLLHLNALVQALEGDPDLSTIPASTRPQVLQSLYVCTGCDYISYFVGISKCGFLSTFFQYASFISSGTQFPGSMGLISLDSACNALYSFLRLIGCAYFRLHASAFEHSSPVSLFHSMGNSDSLWEIHAQWLSEIRNGVWLRADTESRNVPTVEALRLHWQRSLWVLNLWNCSTGNEVELPELTDYGWKRSGGKLEIVWDTPQNMERAKQRVDFVLNGCTCKTGCKNRRCGCKKGNRRCGPGCRCISCTNVSQSLDTSMAATAIDTDSDSESDELLDFEREEAHCADTDDGRYTDDSEEEDTDRVEMNLCERDIDTIMSSIFGEDEEEMEDFF